MSATTNAEIANLGLAPRVAVVGGGLAGISAALACADAGAQVTLFEKQARLGGLTWSFTHDGLVMDNGQHVFLRCCTSYLDFLDRIGSAGDVELQERLDVAVLQPKAEGGELHGGTVKRGTLRRDPLRAPLHLGRSLLGYGLLPLSARLRLGPAALALSRLDLNDPALDEQTFATWLAEHGQGEAAISALWDLICLPTVNLPAAEASLSMAAKVFQTGLLTDASAADIGWSRVPLGLLHGERAASALRKAGVEVRLNEPVDSVHLSEHGAGRVWASESAVRSGHVFEVQTANGRAGADGVVVALPHYCTEDVLPAGALPEHVQPSKLGSSPIVNVHIQFDRRVTDLPFLAGLGTQAQWGFDRTASAGAATGQYLAVSISAADQCIGARPEDLGPEVVQSLRALLPAARPATVLRTLVTREHNATFRAAPGSAVRRAPTRTKVPGLVVAGAWTATGWPPTMEGAVRSGVSAARAVLASVGQRDGLPPLPRAANLAPRRVLRRERRAGGKTELNRDWASKMGAEMPGPGVGQEAATSSLSPQKKLEEVV